MISMQSTIDVAGLSGADLIDFMLHCTDGEYQAWWPGTHLAFHTVERCPGSVGNVVYMDEFIGKRRVRMAGVVTEVVPAKKLVWQFKKVLRLPAHLILEVEDKESSVVVTHTLQVGFRGIGRLLDPLLRIYFSDAFESAMDEHARTEFPMLRKLLDRQLQG
jgi:hypothetical protein